MIEKVGVTSLAGSTSTVSSPENEKTWSVLKKRKYTEISNGVEKEK